MPSDPPLRRHDLVRVDPAAWRAWLRDRPAEAAELLLADPLLAKWADRGWPFVARRPAPGEAPELVPLGLPLPPSHGKRRLALLLQPSAVLSRSPPPLLRGTSAPAAWRPTLERVAVLCDCHGVTPRLFGSLAWAALTGLDYLSASSDLDLLVPLPGDGSIAALTQGLAEVELDAPMRLDGEVIRDDGAAVHWRELHGGADALLVKTLHGVALRDRSWFLDADRRP